MFAQMLNAMKGFGTGASGAATSGTFGAGGQGFLSGQGTAMGGNALSEFGAAPTAGANVAGGLEGFMGKLQGLQDMTPEQQMQIATQMAQFAAPPPMQAMQAMPPRQPPQQQYASFMNPAGQAPAPAPQMRTPLGMRG